MYQLLLWTPHENQNLPSTDHKWQLWRLHSALDCRWCDGLQQPSPTLVYYQHNYCSQLPPHPLTMNTQGPYTRKSLSFLSPMGVLFVEEKDPLYQALVELKVIDDSKAQHLSFMFNLGLLAVDTENFVKLCIPPEARSFAFALLFPLAARLISAHDNLCSYSIIWRRRSQQPSCKKMAMAEKV
jgi:hypothetical protein